MIQQIRFLGDQNAQVNPARAGMIPRFLLRLTLMRGKPRASGDDPATRVSPAPPAG